MMYKCPQCGNTAEQAGNCPACNVPMNEVKEEAPSQPQAEPQAEPQPQAEPKPQEPEAEKKE